MYPRAVRAHSVWSYSALRATRRTLRTTSQTAVGRHKEHHGRGRPAEAMRELREVVAQPSKEAAWQLLQTMADRAEATARHCSLLLSRDAASPHRTRAEDARRLMRCMENAHPPIQLDGYLTKGLHDAFAHDGELAEAVDVVRQATLCGAMRRKHARGVTTVALRRAALGDLYEGWRYMAALTESGLGHATHSIVLLEACNSREEAMRVLADINSPSRNFQPNAKLYAVLHRKLMGWHDFRAAAQTLTQAQQEGVWSKKAAAGTAVTWLQALQEGGLATVADDPEEAGRQRAAGGRSALRYFNALRQAGVAQMAHFNLAISAVACTEAKGRQGRLEMLLDTMRSDGVLPASGTVQAEHKAWLAVFASDGAMGRGAVRAAAAALRDGVDAGLIPAPVASTWARRAINEFETEASVVIYMEELQHYDLLDSYHFSAALGKTQRATSVQEILQHMKRSGIALTKPTYTAAHAAFLRCDDLAEATVGLQELECWRDAVRR